MKTLQKNLYYKVLDIRLELAQKKAQKVKTLLEILKELEQEQEPPKEDIKSLVSEIRKNLFNIFTNNVQIESYFDELTEEYQEPVNIIFKNFEYFENNKEK